MPAELQAHLRYPEDLFRVQTNMWGRYHIDDAQDFYKQADAWDVAQDPGTTTVGHAADPDHQRPGRGGGRSGARGSTRTTCSCGCPARSRRTS